MFSSSEGVEKMKLSALLFTPTAPFKTEITTNTLFGSICWGLRKFYGEETLKEFLSEYQKKSQEPPLLFSSPLPLDKQGRIWFVRPPLEGSIFEGKSQEELRKKYPLNKAFKKITWINWEILKEILEGRIKTEGELFNKILRNVNPQIGKEEGDIKEIKEALEAYKKMAPSLKKPVIAVKNTINRLTFTVNFTGLYNEMFYIYNPFVVLVKINNPEWFEKVKRALKVVRLGGNKTVGMGKFTIEERKEIIPKGMEDFIGEASKLYMLSPTSADPNINIEESFYEIKVERTAIDKTLGYFDPKFLKLPVWKKQTMYIKEGSILSLKKAVGYTGELKEVLTKQIEGETIRIFAYGFGWGLVSQNHPSA